MSLAPARVAALEVLAEVRRREGYAPAILDAVIAKRSLSPADRALATRLAYGTLQSEGTLDEALDSLLKRPHLEPRVRDALRLAAYELLFACTPERAAVNEGVEAVRHARPQAAGMANAVLRRLAEKAPSFPWGDPETDRAALSRLTAHPRWLVDRLVADLGHVAASMMLHADQDPAPLFLAVNPFKATPEEAMARLTAEGADPVACEPPGCLRALAAAAGVRSSAVRDGLVLVMDAGAQVAPLVLGAMPGEAIADLASGRGNKTVLVQAHALAHGGTASVCALDVHAFKADALRRRMTELGVPGVTALAGDATALAAVEGLPAAGTLHRVLLDVPCSNTGTLRRHPEKRWRLKPADIGRLAVLQRSMLSSAASLVRPGGLVVYSTCSVLTEENAAVIRSFLAEEGARFRIRRAEDLLPEGFRRFVGEEGTFQSLPERDGPDGHFVAALERIG